MASFVLGLLPWPLSDLTKVLTAERAREDLPSAGVRYAQEPILTSLAGHFGLTVAAAWKIAVAAIVYAVWAPNLREEAAALNLGWIGWIALRDLLITAAVGCTWDFFHLSKSSPFYEKLKPYKFDPLYPKGKQLWHDAFWAITATAVSTAWEVVLFHLWSRNVFQLRTTGLDDAWWRDVPTVLLLLAIPYFQTVHFYIIHRLMHKWSLPFVPDLGAWLYRHVHSLHHLSRNPTAWSGISMHPVESAIFYSTMLLAAAAGAHPIVILHCKFYNTVVAMVGHEGFGDPSTGGHAHWLHHRLIACNYGNNFVPTDWLFGTWARDEADFVAQFGAKVATADKEQFHEE